MMSALNPIFSSHCETASSGRGNLGFIVLSEIASLPLAPLNKSTEKCLAISGIVI
jgi:hypothetical protein